MAPLTTFKSVETPSISKLKQIISNWDDLSLDRQDDPLTKLKEYLSNAKDGKIPVSYAHSAKAKISGRQFVRGGCGLQSFQKAIRHTIASETYRDYDIVNAHPVLLNQYCERNGIAHKFLDGYIKAREAYLETLKDDLSREEAKNLILQVLNGGLAEYKKLQKKPMWLRDFKDEIEDIHLKVAEKNLDLVKVVKASKEFNVNGSVMNHILCDIENTVLVASVEFLKLNGTSVENIVLVFDGFMLPKSLEVDLEAMTAYVEQKTGYAVSVIEKPMTYAIDLSKCPEVEPEPETDFSEFEKTHLKVKDPVGFIREKHDGSVQFLNEHELNVLYKHMEPVGTGRNKQPFIQAWLHSPTIRTYETQDFIPPPMTCPPDVYNSWRGMVADEFPTHGSPNLMLEHFHCLFPDQEVCSYVLKWFAQIVQKPSVKTGIGMVWKSVQGVGKGIILETLMAKLLGKYFSHVGDPKTQLFGQFGEARNRKLLVNIDDANVGDVKMNMERLKGFITGVRIDYEQKGKQAVSLLNCSNFIMTTQKDCPIKIEATDRRWVVFECDAKQKGNVEYFDRLIEWVSDDANVGAFYEYLKSIDLEGFNFCKERPITEAYNDTKMASADKELFFLASLLQGDKTEFRADTLHGDYMGWLRNAGFLEYRPKNLIEFGRYVSKVTGLVKRRTRTHMVYAIDKDALVAHLVENGVQPEGVCLVVGEDM